MTYQSQSNDLAYQMALSEIEGLGPVRQLKLLKHFLSGQNIFQATHNDLMATGIVSVTLVECIRAVRDITPFQKRLEWILSQGIKIAQFRDSDYPVRLLQISSFPLLFFYQGGLEALHAARIMGVVGTRRMTEYGQNMTSDLVDPLVASGFSIVSGLAAGIDSCAHRKCLKLKGRTVAVLAQGVDRAYPHDHQGLFEDIIAQGGCVLSEFPLLTKRFDKVFFPRRNRIISGLSDGVLVIEAGERSGALITARYALEQNRNVYAVPGGVHQRQSHGCLQLIRDGAKLVMQAQDILEDYGFGQKVISKVNPQPTLDFFESPLEKKIYELCCEARLMDELIELIDEPASYVSATITKMQLAGRIKEVAGRRFVVEG